MIGNGSKDGVLFGQDASMSTPLNLEIQPTRLRFIIHSAILCNYSLTPVPRHQLDFRANRILQSDIQCDFGHIRMVDKSWFPFDTDPDWALVRSRNGHPNTPK
jgi:hypothetical protein